MAAIEETPCPACGERTLRIEFRLEAKPIGTFSLAGAQMKLTTKEVAYLVCDHCGVEARSKN